MAIVNRKLLGEGSVCSILLKKLHPADRVAHFIPNAISMTWSLFVKVRLVVPVVAP